jgi:hypothetical protein
MFTESPAVFLADFGVPCVANWQTFQGILSQPDSISSLEPAHIQTREYTLRFATADAAPTRGKTINVNGLDYTVREAPQQIDDGVFSTVLLSKV